MHQISPSILYHSAMNKVPTLPPQGQQTFISLLCLFIFCIAHHSECHLCYVHTQLYAFYDGRMCIPWWSELSKRVSYHVMVLWAEVLFLQSESTVTINNTIISGFHFGKYICITSWQRERATYFYLTSRFWDTFLSWPGSNYWILATYLITEH